MGDWQQNPISAVVGAPLCGGKPFAYSWEGDNTQHVIYRGVDQMVHEIFYKKSLTGGKWEYGGAISAKAGAPLAGGEPSGFVWEKDKSQHIIYRGIDYQIHELWFRHGMMSHEWKYGGAINAMVGAPAASGDPFGYVWEDDGTQHVIYRGEDGQIHELFYRHGIGKDKWEYGGALNAKAGAPKAAGDPSGFSWEKDNSQHIVYRGVDNQIHELYYQHGVGRNEWKYEGALSARVGAPAADSDPMGFAWEGDKTQHIIYRGADNLIHEIWFSKSLSKAEWKYGGPISAKTGAPAAIGDPFGYAWEKDKTQHIVYRSADSHVHELWFRKELINPSWKYGTALSITARGGEAASDPIGFAWEHDNSQHVIYQGKDGIIRELWQKK